LSWCDKLASTPAAGFKMDLHFASTSAITQALTPIIDELAEDNVPKFSLTSTDQFNALIAGEDGFTYGIDPSGVNVTFQHRMKPKQVSAGPPIMEMLSRPMPFTQLLPDVFERLTKATLLAPNPNGKRRVNRVGIVSLTMVAEDELPPGIALFIEYMSRPWGIKAKNFHFQITTEVGKDIGGSWTDYCTHVVAKQDSADSLIGLNFDWHRSFETSKVVTEDSLKDMLRKAKNSALGYFESLGEGSQFDAEIISAKIPA
jgi:hypothetical protein